MSGHYDLTIEQGTSFNVVFTWSVGGTPVDLTGWNARAQVRSMVTSAMPLLDLTVGDGITLGDTLGTISLHIPVADTTTLPAPFSGVWDLEMVSDVGTVTRLLEGAVTVTPEVTR